MLELQSFNFHFEQYRYLYKFDRFAISNHHVGRCCTYGEQLCSQREIASVKEQKEGCCAME